MAERRSSNETERTSAAAETPQHWPWQSPVPYLFGGLAAMLGLIAFALLILACSYWKLSGFSEGDDEGRGVGDRDLEAGEGGKGDGDIQKLPAAMEEKILVIMAGQVKPTYLATPMSSSTSSFVDGSEKSCCCDEKQNDKAEGGVQLQMGSTVNHDQSSNQNH